MQNKTLKHIDFNQVFMKNKTKIINSPVTPISPNSKKLNNSITLYMDVDKEFNDIVRRVVK